MKVRVYLNDPEDRYARFSEFDPASARLRLAVTFDMDDDDPPSHGTGDKVFHLLNEVFQQLNVGGDLVPATDWTAEYRVNRNRSLSVGDVVVLGETAWAVDHMGFSTISTDALKGAL